MATALAVTPPKEESARDQSERLGAEITELCSYIYAGERMDWNLAVSNLCLP